MIGEVYQSALDQYFKRPVPWILFNAIVVVAGTVIPVLGALALLPSALRETAACIEEDRDPDLAALVDLSTIADDLGAMALYVGAQLVGLLMCLVGWPVAWLLFWLTPEIRAARMVGAVDAMKLSASFTLSNLGTIIALALINAVILSLGTSIAFVGSFLALPLVMLSWTTYMLRVQPELAMLAEEKGMRLLGDDR